MEQTLVELLFGVINTQSPDTVDYQIAWFILEHYDEMKTMTLSELASRCNVAKSSISRFCTRLGLEDFLELHILVRNLELRPQEKFSFPGAVGAVGAVGASRAGAPTPSPAAPTGATEGPAPTAEQASEQERYLDAVIAAVQAMKRHGNPRLLDHLVQEIHESPNVVAIGHMQSGDIALSLQHDLHTAGKLIKATSVAQTQRQWLASAHKGDVMIAFSSRGRLFNRLRLKRYVDDALDCPSIYLVTNSATAPQPPYVTTISLAHEDSYSTSNLLTYLYAKMIALAYYERYR